MKAFYLFNGDISRGNEVIVYLREVLLNEVLQLK